MKYFEKYLILAAAVLLGLQITVAQQTGDLLITGTVVESNAGQPIAFATILLVAKQDGAAISGATTDENGRFEIETSARDFNIEVSFIGFASRTIDSFSLIGNRIDVGMIVLEEDAQQLEEVVVEGEISKMEFKLDRRVFNVGSDISSTGMSVLEVLNNVPSVNVNIEGEISLRGSTGVQILIDGKPTILADEANNALGTITADMIKSIEVITNPSAKYDAEGTTGILNIILNKEEKEGLNGSISVNTGSPDNHSIGVSLNRRTQRFNLFTQIGAGYRSLPRESNTANTNLITGSEVRSAGTAFRNETFSNITLGTDYHINDLNVITLSGNFAYEKEEQPSELLFERTDENGESSVWNRVETTDAGNPKWQYELQYKKQFEDDEEHSLLISAIGQFFGKDLASEFNNIAVSGADIPADQQTETKFSQADYTFKLDYTNPISEKYGLEAGGQFVINDVGNDYEVRELIDGIWQPIPELTNNFTYDQQVLALYGSGSYESGKWGVKLGLRAEHTNLNTLLTNTDERNSQLYTDLFPSAHTTYKLTEKTSLQLGYSKRIFRPRLWHLNPFFNIRDNFNIRTGNPNLLPEYTDSFELTSVFTFSNASLNGTVFYRYTTDTIERVSVFEDNVQVSIPLNIGTDEVTGIELNGKYLPAKWMTLNGDFNLSYFNRNGQFEDQNFDFSGERWRARLTAKFKLPLDIDLETIGNYRSGYPTVQGEVLGTAFADLAMRKKFVRGKLVFSLAVRDVFSSRNFESNIVQAEFSSSNFNQRGRFITLGFSYGFGKGEAMTYSGGRRR